MISTPFGAILKAPEQLHKTYSAPLLAKLNVGKANLIPSSCSEMGDEDDEAPSGSSNDDDASFPSVTAGPVIIVNKTKGIKKAPRARNRGFKPEETSDYSLKYERNDRTGRMNKVWTCKLSDCQKQFRRVCGLKEHLRIHKSIKAYHCELCGKGWVQKGNRDRHQSTGCCLQKPK